MVYLSLGEVPTTGALLELLYPAYVGAATGKSTLYKGFIIGTVADVRRGDDLYKLILVAPVVEFENEYP